MRICAVRGLHLELFQVHDVVVLQPVDAILMKVDGVNKPRLRFHYQVGVLALIHRVVQELSLFFQSRQKLGLRPPVVKGVSLDDVQLALR